VFINCFGKAFRAELLVAQRWGGRKSKEIALEKRGAIIKRLILSPDDQITSLKFCAACLSII
jgi:hypothetical protein